MSKKRSNVSNQDVFLVAANNIGADRQFVDAEDVYVEAHRLTPHRFSWRTKRELIDLAGLERIFRKVSNNTHYLIKEGKYLLRLSSLGLDWVKHNRPLCEELNGKKNSNKFVGNNRNTGAINRFKRTIIYQNWLAHEGMPDNKSIVAQALGCLPNRPLAEFERRMELLAIDAAFAGDRAVTKFLELLNVNKENWFEGRSV